MTSCAARSHQSGRRADRARSSFSSVKTCAVSAFSSKNQVSKTRQADLSSSNSISSSSLCRRCKLTAHSLLEPADLGCHIGLGNPQNLRNLTVAAFVEIHHQQRTAQGVQSSQAPMQVVNLPVRFWCAGSGRHVDTAIFQRLDDPSSTSSLARK